MHVERRTVQALALGTMTLTPYGKWIVFPCNFERAAHVHAVDAAKASGE